jgi:NTP pyrophosphatase (non-canonical NTP hydrolase)
MPLSISYSTLGFTLNQYHQKALGTASYPSIGSNIIYPALGLAGEAGEVADKIKKLWRNKGLFNPKDYPEEDRLALKKELGDVLWYVAACANELGYSLEEVAVGNNEKLADRAARGTIKSEGDDR